MVNITSTLPGEIFEGDDVSFSARFSGQAMNVYIPVMAVMAILAGAIAPAVFQMMEDAYETAEAENLKHLGDALRQVVRNDKRIPSLTSSDWSVALADYASIAPANVLLNERNQNRRLYADPMFFTNSNQTFAGYSQTTGLSSRPYSPRLMLISNLDGSVSANLNSHTLFSDVWEQTSDAVLVESDSLLIERINLAPEFYEVVLSNANSAQAGYVLDAGAEGAIAAAVGGADGSRAVFVLSGTRLALRAAPYPGGTTQRQILLADNQNFRYQLDGGIWVWE